MTPGKQQVLKMNITVAATTGTGTLTKQWDVARWIRVVPVAETDSFDVTIKDADGHIMVKRTGQVGTFSEMLELSMGIASTVLIENATQDGTYTAKFDLH